MYYSVHDLDGNQVEEGILNGDIFDLVAIRNIIEEKLPEKNLIGKFLASLYEDGTEDHPFAIITVQRT